MSDPVKDHTIDEASPRVVSSDLATTGTGASLDNSVFTTRTPDVKTADMAVI